MGNEPNAAESGVVQEVGWIGTGVMGAAMCGHLLAAGHRVAVYNRTRAHAQPVIDAGAVWQDSPGQVAAAADVVFTMVGHPADVREVVLGGDGVLAGARPESVVVDTSTSEPALAREIDAAARAAGVQALDAPVTGGDVGARDGTLVIMVGGEEAALARIQPLLSEMARLVVHQGGAGAGQHAKMVNQIAIATGMIGVCEALLYAQRAGLDVARVIDTIAGGAAGSWSLSNYGPRMLRGDYAPGFKVEHFIKDLGIALAEATRMRLALPGLALAQQLYVAAAAQGHEQDGTQSLIAALAQCSGVEWRGDR